MCEKRIANHSNKTLACILFASMVLFSQFSCKQDKEDHKNVADIPQNSQVSLYEEGKILFQQNCGMCHKIDQQAAGIALNSFPNRLRKNELFEILVEGKKHPKIKISQNETEALAEFINKKER